MIGRPVLLGTAVAATVAIAAALYLLRPPPVALPTLSTPTPTSAPVVEAPTAAPCIATTSDGMPPPGAQSVTRNTAIAFRFIPPGCYPRELGTLRQVKGRWSFPFHRRDTITRGFWMAETETTQDEWFRLMGDRPSTYKDCGDCPVESVSWVDAVMFANALSAREGLSSCYSVSGTDVQFAGLECPGFRLATLSEWKYAFRGTEGRRFPWGDEEPTTARANYGKAHEKPMPVRFFPGDRTPEGVYGMGANVSEWVNDWSEEGIGSKEDQIDPLGAPSGTLRHWAGTDYLQTQEYVQMAGGGAMLPELSNAGVGVRLVRTWRGPE